MPLTPHIISSLRGGLNEHPPASISDDQCTIANNVEWVTSPLGERRKGAVGIDLGTSLLAGCNFIMWMHRHTPVSNQAETQLWAMGHKDGVALLAYKDTVWHDVPMPDPLIFDGAAEYHVDAQSLHGKLFIAYKSAVNRLHVWDGTEFRRTGLASIYTGVQPLVVNMAGTATGFTKYRYYRIRFVKMVSGVVVLRSEPGAPVGFMPSGTAPGAQVERTVAPGESETHWELEAGQDNVLYYRVATTPIATLHANDTTPDDQYATVNGIGWPLTEDIGDYSLLPSCRHLSADEDRLVLGSSWSDPRITSRVMWTPPAGAVGVANDERMALDTNPYLDLDTYEGGDITALSSTVNGYIYATKWRHIYQLIRTGVPTRAYEAVPLTKQRGAIPGSLVEGFDQGGKPFCFILDPDIGPCMVGGAQGIEPCGDDLIATWPHVNVDAILPCRSLYFPEKRQVMWWVAYDSQSPNLRIVLHTNLMRRELEGTRGSSGGFALWYGASAIIFACCLYSDNIDTGGLRTRRLKPFVGIAGAPLIARTDTGDSDWDIPFTAVIKTKAVVRAGLLSQFECGEAQLMTTATPNAKIDVQVIGMRADLERVTKTITGLDLTTGHAEGAHAIHSLDDLGLAELQTIQVQIADSPADPVSGPQWQLELLSLSITGGQQVRG